MSIYKLTCNNCNKLYIGRTKRKFKPDLMNTKRAGTSTGKFTFSEHIPNEGHETRSMGETRTILHFGKTPRESKLLKEWRL